MFPEDLGYTEQHVWLRAGNGATVRVGITESAAQALGDVVYVSLPQVGQEVALDDGCADIESTQSTSEVFAPVSGVITSVNTSLGTTPEAVNTDPYGDGWLFDVEMSDPSELDDLMDADSYAALVGED